MTARAARTKEESRDEDPGVGRVFWAILRAMMVWKLLTPAIVPDTCVDQWYPVGSPDGAA
jgi:hypothetical protein